MSVRYAYRSVVALAVLLLLVLSAADPRATVAQTNILTIPLGQDGFTDSIPRQIVRTVDDRVFIAAGRENGSPQLGIYFTTAPGLPQTAADFGGSALATAAGAVLTVDMAYDGGTFIHLIVNTANGVIQDFPFNITTNAFQPAITLFTDGGTFGAGLYVGTVGVSALFDTLGQLQVAYWTNTNQIVHQALTYNAGTNTLTPASAITRVDAAGQANHPSLVVSPVDNSVTVAWVSQATNPAQILARTRSVAGVWGALETVSTVPVWTSPVNGINIDQGPNMIVDAAGTAHLTYIQDFGPPNGDYGTLRYATRASGSAVWTDTTLPVIGGNPNLNLGGYTQTHNPMPALAPGGQLFMLGHGPVFTNQNTSQFVLARNADGTWGPHVPVIGPVNTFDASNSVKWSVVGFNRPEVVEWVFFLAPGGLYDDATLYYGRFDPLLIPTPVPAPPADAPPAQAAPQPVFDPLITQLLVGSEAIVNIVNVGSGPGLNPVITIELPAGATIDQVIDTNGAVISINGSTVTLTYPDFPVGASREIRVRFRWDGALGRSTACIRADNLNPPRCVTSQTVTQLPATGETPWWRMPALMGLLSGFLLLIGWGAWRRRTVR